MVQSNTREYRPDTDDGRFRRSLYTYWKRACPPPALLTLDAPTREVCTIRRQPTNTPLQALVLWNDAQFVAAGRALAERVLLEVRPGDAGGSDDRTERQRLDTLHRRCTGRPLPDALMPASLATLATLRQRFGSAPDDAARLVATPLLPASAMPAGNVAPWAALAGAFLCLDTTLSLD
jgi:hypothetical protein